MKKILKFFTYVLLYCILFALLFYFWFSNVWRVSENRNYYEGIVAQMKNTKPIPDSLVNVYLKVNETEKDNSLLEEFFLRYGKALVTGNYGNEETHNCLCNDIVSSMSVHDVLRNKTYWLSGTEALKMSFGLETMAGDEACFNYFLRTEYEDLSREFRYSPYSFAGKQIDEISTEEYLEFLVVKKAPTMFNKFRNHERFQQRKEALEKLLHK